MSNFLAGMIRGGIIPVLRIYFCFAISASVWGNAGMAEAARLFSRCLSWLLKGCGALFSLVLGLQTILAGNADSAALRVGRSLLSGAIPVVGDAAAAALSSSAAAVQLLKGSLALAALAALAAMFLPAFAQCALYFLAFSGSGIVACGSGQDQCGQICRNLAEGGAAVCGCACAVFFHGDPVHSAAAVDRSGRRLSQCRQSVIWRWGSVCFAPGRRGAHFLAENSYKPVINTVLLLYIVSSVLSVGSTADWAGFAAGLRSFSLQQAQAEDFTAYRESLARQASAEALGALLAEQGIEATVSLQGEQCTVTLYRKRTCRQHSVFWMQTVAAWPVPWPWREGRTVEIALRMVHPGAGKTANNSGRPPSASQPAGCGRDCRYAACGGV